MNDEKARDKQRESVDAEHDAWRDWMREVLISEGCDENMIEDKLNDMEADK
jgi:Spy/CpxP family protein refolding chaperone